MSTQPPATPPQPKTLYVICHGALALLQTDYNLIIMIPDLGSIHTYRAGTWLAETTIEKGSLNILESVTGGAADVPNLLDTTPRPATAARPPFATFILPRPLKVHPLFQVKIPKDTFTLASGPNPLSDDLVIPFVPVLEYSYTDTPKLGDIWPVVSDDLTGIPDNPLTLHIFAEDERPLNDGHPTDAFNRTCELLGLNLILTPEADQGLRLHAASQEPLPPGLENRCFEFQPLVERRAALLAIAKAKESGTNVPDPWASLPCGNLTLLGRLFFDIDSIQDNNNASCLSVPVGGRRGGG
jgi:hypothetical protein